MNKKYVLSLDGEDWSEECYDSRDEVIQAGLRELDGWHFWIAVACPPEFYAVENKEKIEPKEL